MLKVVQHHFQCTVQKGPRLQYVLVCSAGMVPRTFSPVCECAHAALARPSRLVTPALAKRANTLLDLKVIVDKLSQRENYSR